MIKDTVFSPSFGNRPTYLVGREQVISTFMDGLQSQPGNRDRAIVMLGQRGSGKTVLLWELADRAREAGFVVASPTVASEDMLSRIVEKIQDDGEQYVKERSTHLVGGSVGAFGFTAGLQFNKDIQETKSFQYKLTHLSRKLTEQGKGILILVDELQANSSEIRQLVIAYQELVGERQNIALVMAGLPGAVSATLNDSVLTFLNRARKVSLNPLSVNEVDAFFSSAFNQLGLQVPDTIRKQAAKATQGSPYMLQVLGHNLVLYASSDGVVTAEEYERALRASQDDFENDICKTTLASLSEKDVEFLAAMSLDCTDSKISEIAKRMDVAPDYAQKYRKRLIDAGVISASGRGKVKFEVPYLADYLHKKE